VVRESYKVRQARLAKARRALWIKIICGIGIVIFVIVSSWVIITFTSPERTRDFENRTGIDIRRPSN